MDENATAPDLDGTLDSQAPGDHADTAEPAAIADTAAESVLTEPESEGAGDTADEAKAFDPAAFDDAIRHVLASSGGELLFRMPAESVGGDEVAAVRLGQGEAQLVALVILPGGGAPVRVEPVDDSANPLAPIAQSYASLVNIWKTAA